MAISAAARWWINQAGRAELVQPGRHSHSHTQKHMHSHLQVFQSQQGHSSILPNHIFVLGTFKLAGTHMNLLYMRTSDLHLTFFDQIFDAI